MGNLNKTTLNSHYNSGELEMMHIMATLLLTLASCLLVGTAASSGRQSREAPLLAPARNVYELNLGGYSDYAGKQRINLHVKSALSKANEVVDRHQNFLDKTQKDKMLMHGQEAL